MNKGEKKRLSAVLRATEYLFLENIGLKLVLEHRAVANWQKLLDHLLSDKEMLAGVRLKFSDFYREIERSAQRHCGFQGVTCIPICRFSRNLRFTRIWRAMVCRLSIGHQMGDCY